MSELSTVLINDSRYNAITDRVTIGVKDGPASVSYQKYQPNSNSTSSTLFNVNVQSEILSLIEIYTFKLKYHVIIQQPLKQVVKNLLKLYLVLFH